MNSKKDLQDIKNLIDEELDKNGVAILPTLDAKISSKLMGILKYRFKLVMIDPGSNKVSGGGGRRIH